MKTQRIFLVLSLFLIHQIQAQTIPAYNNNRIAISADGNNQPDLSYTGKYNTADPDDWGATPATLIMIAKRQLQNKLVHFSYNNFMPSPPHTTKKNYMKIATDQGAERLKFNSEVFFDVGTHKKQAITSLKKEILKSTASDPLFFVNMGPSEFFYQTIKTIVEDGTSLESMAHVYIISHSGYNDNHLRRANHHTMKEAIALSGNRLKYKKIKDQNNCEVLYLGWCSKKKPYHWRHIRDHKDPHIQWLWERMLDHKHGKFDISDAGMVYYLLTGDEDGSPSKFTDFIGYGIMLPGDKVAEAIDITEESITVYENKAHQLNFSFTPKASWDDYFSWKTSNANVAYVSPNGRVVGVSPGKATITITAGIGNFTDKVNVEVKRDSECEIITYDSGKDFKQLKVKGFVPSYIDKWRKVVAVDASKYQGEFGASKTVFKGETRRYDITVTSLTETDGESTYKLKIGNSYIGEFQNPESDKDYKKHTFTFKNVLVKKGQKIQIESNTHSNGKVPEGNAYAFSRGRWKSIEFHCPKKCELVEKDGFLVLEAERFELKGDWILKENNLASSGKYIMYSGPNSYKTPNLKNEISYTFNITNPGNYSVRWFMRQPDEAEGDKSNDAWIKMEGNAGLFGEEQFTDYRKFVGRSKQVFAMNGKLEAHHHFANFNCNFNTPGKYTIKIVGRSTLLQIDKLVFYKNDISNENAAFKASEVTETTSCADEVILKSNTTE
ncbi:Ig-like domain-containing protein [Seonamhaeicola marinus]|uniref:Ig-like domain-containing protein n=1 Tax=Seonamhaeicola marinus TaxID=1912246 RepID=A0A5D0HF67_9FLAO|nr:Ig-like domain-containing protein [Seonamhaeicola marinus]TYA69936.1 Ig-like domain-containing protein [Seonamhaeicola marinus]